MPASGINERPTTFRSGTTLQPKYSVQHRSDILLVEQTETVRNAQNTLSQILNDLENAKTEEEIDQMRSEATAAKDKAESAIMVLQILYKIDAELNFARKDLDDALEHENGDIMAARKRVMWLEDKMGTLCGKIRIRGQPSKPSHRRRGSDERGGMTFRSGFSDNDDLSDDDVFNPRQRMLPPIASRLPDSEEERSKFTPSLSGSEDYRHMHHQRTGLMDTPSSEEGSSMMPPRLGFVHKAPGAETSESESEAPSPDAAQVNAEAHSEGSEGHDQLGALPVVFQKERQDVVAPSSDNQEQTSTAEEPEVQEPAETEKSVQDTSSGKTSQMSEDSEEESSSEDESESDEEEEEREAEKEEQESRESKEEETEEEKHEEDHEEEAQDKVPNLEAEAPQDAEKRGQTFMTEVSVQSKPSRVTIVSPKREDTRAAFLREISEEERDLVMEYWQSEHHRFEYGEYADVMCQLDPLSYHQMGLAVPGTFLYRSDKEYQLLPWHEQSKNGTDITDIHKNALDKLAIRIHKMYDKIYQAAMLSVRPLQKDITRREKSLLHSFDMSKEGTTISGLTKTSLGTTLTAAPADPSRPQTMQTIETVSMPKLQNRRLGTSKSGRLVYYPKPIPPPELLPITRTTVGKEYPRLANTFAYPDPKERKPAVRVCNQRNLVNETKLTLFKERTRGKRKGPSTTEKKFRRMLEERDKSSISRKSTDSRGVVSRTVTKISGDFEDELVDLKTESVDEEASVWSKMKPKNKSREYSGLKWERVKSLVHNSLVSKRNDERIDAAKHLGLLRCGDTMVFYALKERMKLDEDERVRYEAAKSLIHIGAWEDDVLQVIIKYLALGNTEIRLDLIRTMIDGKNVQYVNKNMNTFPELAKMLSYFCRNPDPEDAIALDAAVLLGKLCVCDDNAKLKLKRSLDFSQDTHVKAKSLEILVKQLNCRDYDIVKSILDMLNKSYVWKNRALAADLLITLGPKNVLVKGPQDEKVYDILERRIWDDPSKEVRIAAAKALAALGLFKKACDNIEKRLESPDEDARAEAVISVGTLEMKSEKINRMLLEMFELDPSDYVRLMIVRTFVALRSTEPRILRALKEKEKIDGPLARECKKALKALESLRELITPPGRRTTTPRTKPVVSSQSQNNNQRPLTLSV